MSLVVPVLAVLAPAFVAALVWVLYAWKLGGTRVLRIVIGLCLLCGTYASGYLYKQLERRYFQHFQTRDMSYLLFRLVVERDAKLEEELRASFAKNPNLSESKLQRILGRQPERSD